MNHEELYARLRAEILARHFSLSRYTRADHFGLQAFLGTPHRAKPDDHDASPGGITWSPPRHSRGSSGAPTPLYQNAADLRDKLRTRELADVERWRWAKHDRTNALLMTGMRIVSLVVDARAGDPLAWHVLKRILNTLDALFRFKNGPAPFQGYLVRWDAVASDLWETRIRKKRGGGAVTELVQNCEFLLNGDPKTFAGGDYYLYCTPLKDPRHREAIRVHDEHREVGNPTPRGGDRFRRWEPSMDEYLGLTVGYFMIWHTFRDDPENPFWSLMSHEQQDKACELVEQARTQVRRVGHYLKATGYYLVRPCGGFTFRGGLDINPVMEFPLARAFSRITGDPLTDYLPERSATFERAIELAGYGPEYDDFHVDSIAAGASIAENLTAKSAWLKNNPDGRNVVQQLLTAAVPLLPQNLLKAAMFQTRLELKGSGDDEAIGRGALNYLLNYVARHTAGPPEAGSWMVFQTLFPALQTNSPATDFAPLIGLTALDDPDESVANAYFEWYGRLRARSDVPGAQEIEPGDVPSGCTVTAVAVRHLLKPGDRTAAELESHLDAMRLKIVKDHASNLLIGNYPQPGSPDPTVAEYQDCARCYFGYVLPMSLAWLHLVRNTGPAFSSIGLPTASGLQHWEPSVPGEVVEAAGNRFHFPVSWIQRSPLTPGQASYPLFKDPPARPRDKDLGPAPEAPIVVADFEVNLTDDYPQPPPAWSNRVKRDQRPIPDLPSHLDPGKYHLVASIEDLASSRVDWRGATVESSPSRCTVEVHFEKRRVTIPPDVGNDRRFHAKITVTAVRNPE